MRKKLLKWLYHRFPFSLKGDAVLKDNEGILLSCILPTFKRDADLNVLLQCLAVQNLGQETFEVVVVEDGETTTTGELIRQFSPRLNIRYLTNPTQLNNVASLRNQGLVHSRGELILFLDDDTILPEKTFLRNLIKEFQEFPDIGAIQVPGEASYGICSSKYDYLDRHSFATRCVAYRRSVLADVGGFSEELTSYEDIELAIRFTINCGQMMQAHSLLYRHPPLYFDNWEKPLCNGLSFLRLWSRYSKPVWLLCYLNALRFIPFLLIPESRLRQWGKISAGFIYAPFYQGFQKLFRLDSKVIYR